MDLRQRQLINYIVTFLLAALLVGGVGALTHQSGRIRREQGVNEDLTMKALTLRATLTRLERTRDALADLPPIGSCDWEKDLVEGISAVVKGSGAVLQQLTLNLQTEGTASVPGVVSFRLDIEAGEKQQIECLSRLHREVPGILIDSFNGLLGGKEAHLLGENPSKRMSIVGQVLYEVGNLQDG